MPQQDKTDAFTDRDGTSLLAQPHHRQALLADAERQLRFFRGALRPAGGFYNLALDGTPRPDPVQALHWTTRMIHAFALGGAIGFAGAREMIDHGMAYLKERHHDPRHGGYFGSVDDDGPVDDRKFAYGHAFVLLAGASAHHAGHPGGLELMEDVTAVIDRHFWEPSRGRSCDELTRDFQPFSTYRGMNANMHLAEALMSAYEATGRQRYLDMAGSIFSFFVLDMAAGNNWRIPEHYHEDWTVDPAYSGDPMFRPPGTTPGHSLEFGRLILQYWDLSGRTDPRWPQAARALVERALADAWLPDGGLAYTVDDTGAPAIKARYWWPVTEGIGALAALLHVDRTPQLEDWYTRLWAFADARFIDHAHGGWFAELDAAGQPHEGQFLGKPDIYHALQADLFPLVPTLSRQMDALAAQRQAGWA